MKLIRSDSPEEVRTLAAARTDASRKLPILLLSFLPSLVILFIALVGGLIVSWRAAVWTCAPVFLAWNFWALWRARSPRISWVIKGNAEQVYIRMYVGFGKAWRRLDTPDVIVLEAAEIASVSFRTTEVYLYGPKPENVGWLLIEPTPAVADDFSRHVRPLLGDMRRGDLSERVRWDDDEKRLFVGWKYCVPALPELLKHVTKEYPSIIIGAEEHTELDLNGIWHGNRDFPTPEQRSLLGKALRLGFGCDLLGELGLRRRMSRRNAAALLSEIAREEDEKEEATVPQ